MGIIMMCVFGTLVLTNALFIFFYTGKLFILSMKKQYFSEKRGILKTEVKRIVYHI